MGSWDHLSTLLCHKQLENIIHEHKLYAHSHTHIHIQTDTDTDVHTNKHTHTYIYTYIDTHRHTVAGTWWHKQHYFASHTLCVVMWRQTSPFSLLYVEAGHSQI